MLLLSGRTLDGVDFIKQTHSEKLENWNSQILETVSDESPVTNIN